MFIIVYVLKYRFWCGLQYSVPGLGDRIIVEHSFSLFYCHLSSRNICLLRSLLEGYDGLATLTTISIANGLVCCLVPDGQDAEMCQLLENLGIEGVIYSFIKMNSSPESKRYLFNGI